MKFLDLRSQYQAMQNEIDTGVRKVFEHGQFIMGPEIEELEAVLSSYVDRKSTVTCANGTDALVLALRCLEIGPGDIVLCPTFTYFASAEAVELVGATPIFVDSEAMGFNVCPVDLEAKIDREKRKGNGELKAIIAVDLFGLPADYQALERIARNNDLYLIEDGAQGFGGDWNGKKACSFGDIATTSFFPAKPLGCYGDGGAVFTDDEALAVKLRSLRQHGQGDNKYTNLRIGTNSRLDSIQAAVLLVKIKYLEDEIQKRNAMALRYSDVLRDICETPEIPLGFKSSWAQYTIVSNQRERVQKFLEAHGIPTQIYYPLCMHQQPAFRGHDCSRASFPVAARLRSCVLSLPIDAYATEDLIPTLTELAQQSWITKS